MKKQLVLSILSVLTLMSCNGKTFSTSSSENTITITDLASRENTIKQSDSERVLCIGAGALRLYSYVGDISKLVAVEDIDRSVDSNIFADVSRPYYDLNKEAFSKLPSCGKGGPQAQFAETEKILSCNPTLIISEYEDVTKANDLQEKVGVPVVVVKYGQKSVFDDNIKSSLTLLGKILGKEDKAEKINNYISTCKNELENNAKEVKDEDKPSMYVGCLGNWGKQDIYSTSASFPLFEVSNINNCVTSDLVSNGTLEKEAFFNLNPDKIILDSAGLTKFKTSYEADSTMFDSLDAFKNNEIYLEMPFNAYYTNIEVALMDAYFIASVSYPEIYKDYDLESKYDEISDAFLGQKCYSLVKNAKMSYGGFQKITNIKEFLANV